MQNTNNKDSSTHRQTYNRLLYRLKGILISTENFSKFTIQVNLKSIEGLPNRNVMDISDLTTNQQQSASMKRGNPTLKKR
jgi:hypothetical protein